MQGPESRRTGLRRVLWNLFTKPLFPSHEALSRKIFYGATLVTLLFGFVAIRLFFRTIQTIEESNDLRAQSIIEMKIFGKEMRELKVQIAASIYYPAPDVLTLFGRNFPPSSQLYLRVDSLWSRYLRNRGTTTEMLRIAIQFKDRITYIENEARKRNMPTDIAYLFFHEARLSDFAISRAKATGSCQFMKGTAKDYRLRQVTKFDERLSFTHCVNAALNHLRDVYDGFMAEDSTDSVNGWMLAMAAYNHGVTGVRNAIAKNDGNRDYFALRMHLPRETADYHLKIAIERELILRHAQYGYPMPDLRPLTTICTFQRLMVLSSPVPLKEVVRDTLQFIRPDGGIDYEEFQFCNPYILLRDARGRIQPDRTLQPYKRSSYYVFNIPIQYVQFSADSIAPSYLDTLHVRQY